MSIDQLEVTVILSEIFRMLFIIFTISVLSVKFMLSFQKTRKAEIRSRRELFSLGCAWFTFAIAYIMGTLSFIWIIVYGKPFTNLLLFTIFNVNLAPIVVLSWFYTVFKITEKGVKVKKVKNILFWGCVIFCIIFEAVVLYIEFELQELSLLGSMQNDFEYEYSYFLKWIVGFFLVSTILVGFYFAHKVHDSEIAKIRLKGIYLLIAFVLLVVSTITDAVIAVIDPIFSLIAKILLLSCSFTFYIGYFLPEWWLKKFHPHLL